jgi:hypothetical protein
MRRGDNASGTDRQAMQGVPAELVFTKESKINREIARVDLSRAKRLVDRPKRTERNDGR